MGRRMAMAPFIPVTLHAWPLAMAALGSLAGLVALTPDAMGKQERPRQVAEAAAPRKTGEPIMAIVSIKSQLVTFYDADGWILRAPVSTGTEGRETPAGIFAIVEKDKDHRSTMYDDAWMPNMQRITWNGIALHGGPLPGYPASHGCVRMPYGFADKLFNKTRIGMRVIISPDDTAPLDFSHPTLSLLAPNARALEAARANAEHLAREAAAAVKAAEQAKKAAAIADQLKSRTEGQSLKAPAKVPDLEKQIDAPAGDTKAQAAATGAATDAASTAEVRKETALKAALQAKLALEPFSIFISRATQKLYLRRNTHKRAPDGGGEVFDSSIEIPITIGNPEKRIGTHVFTANAHSDAGLRWTVVTIDRSDEPKSALERVTIPQTVLELIASIASVRSSIIISDEPLSSETNYRTEFVAVLSNQPQGGFATRQRWDELVVSGNVWDGANVGAFLQRGLDSQPRNARPRRGQDD